MAERALYFLNNEYLMSLITENNTVIVPILFPSLYRSSKTHWNRSIHSLIFNALKVLSEINTPLFDECSAKFKVSVVVLEVFFFSLYLVTLAHTREQADLAKEKTVELDRLSKWEKVHKLALKNPLSKNVMTLPLSPPFPC